MKATYLLVIFGLMSYFNFLNAQEGVVILKKSMLIDIMSGKKEPIVKVTEVIDKLVSDPSKANTSDFKESIYYQSEFQSNLKISGYTKVLKTNGRVKKVPVTSILEEDYSSRGVFYSGTKRSIVNFPMVSQGAELHCESSRIYDEIHLIPSFYFNSYYECQSSELIIRVANGIDVGSLEFNLEGNDISYSERVLSDGRTEKKWIGVNFPQRIYGKGTQGISCREPHIVVHVKSFRLDNEENYVLRNKEDLFNWYSSLVKDSKIDSTYSVVVDSLKAVSKDNLKVAESIFNWVQHNVEYIAYEDGFGGFVPRTPSSVLENRYGDCKDMALLTATLMKACDIECYIGWVGTRSKCYTYSNCPTPVTDNHMITVFPLEDSLIFLDPTSSYSQFGMPSGFIQGKEVMVRISPEEFLISTVPEIRAEENQIINVLDVVISDKKIEGHGVTTRTGYEKEDFEAALDYSALSKENLFTDVNPIGNESYSVSNLRHSNYDSNKGNLISTFDYSIENYTQVFDGKIYLNPFLIDVLPSNLDDRKLALKISNRYQYQTVIKLTIPKGKEVKSEIRPTEIKENGYSLIINTRREGSLLIIDYTYQCDRLKVEVSEIEEVNQTIKKMKKLLKQQIEIG
ncbi:MAG: transglutaminase-like domain-containing protein [Crocinitomicaceae bacterium]|nr:transglutaminase-like domain-containing protein [Crocinitomicaceae bacterium]